MPLNKPQLAAAIKSIGENPPASSAACAAAWADAIAGYMAAVAPISTTVAGAKSALQAALTTAFGAPAAAPGMESAFVTFGTAVAGGMVGAGFTGIPPALPVGFATLFAGPKPSTHQAGADAIADLIHGWAAAGLAQPIAPGPTIPWT